MAKKKKLLKKNKKDKKTVYEKTETNNSISENESIQKLSLMSKKDTSNIDFKRLNCEIPKVLHTWLNVYARSSSNESSSMTEIVINVLEKFAKEHGFKTNIDGK